MSQCEACEAELATMVEPCEDPREEYHLCGNCHHRLHSLSLRPLEWYNLAKRHGWWQYALHDDFYTEDGVADQPQEEVLDSSLFPAPKLLQVKTAPCSLLDYSITRWHLDDEALTAWRALPVPAILAALKQRFACTHNKGVRGRMLEICASTVAETGAEFVRSAWAEYPVSCDLVSLAQASACCLPADEGYGRVVNALAALPNEQEKRDLIYALGYFSSPRTLDWIEQNIFPPVTEAWGYLAAASSVDWQRLTAWLSAGRPLSLVAIDTLCAVQRLPTPFLKKRDVRLRNSPSEEELVRVLAGYAAQDPVPRVQQRTNALLAEHGRLTAGG